MPSPEQLKADEEIQRLGLLRSSGKHDKTVDAGINIERKKELLSPVRAAYRDPYELHVSRLAERYRLTIRDPPTNTGNRNRARFPSPSTGLESPSDVWDARGSKGRVSGRQETQKANNRVRQSVNGRRAAGCTSSRPARERNW